MCDEIVVDAAHARWSYWKPEAGGRNPKFEYRNPKQLPNQKSKPKRRRKSAVPQGQPTIAHRFNGGFRRQSIPSPEGTVEVHSHNSRHMTGALFGRPFGTRAISILSRR